MRTAIQRLLVARNHDLQGNRGLHASRYVSRSFKDMYRQFWTPNNPQAPYQHVVQVGDPVLRRKCDPVPAEAIGGPEIKFLIDLMTRIMHKYKCVGLAAPQVGIPLRVIGLEFKDSYRKDFPEDVYATRNMQPLPLTVLVNPEIRIVDYTKTVFPETCASVTGFSGDVTRYQGVVLSGVDYAGKPKQLELRGWNARIAQHEMDHIDGVIYTDVMARDTLTCTCWEAVNRHAGRVKIRFDGD